MVLVYVHIFVYISRCSQSLVMLTLLFCLSPDQDQTVLVFRGGLFWAVSPAGTPSRPLPLQQRWPRLPATIEAAAFSPPDSKWFFFKGV